MMHFSEARVSNSQARTWDGGAAHQVCVGEVECGVAPEICMHQRPGSLSDLM